jgi:hypothetical protein
MTLHSVDPYPVRRCSRRVLVWRSGWHEQWRGCGRHCTWKITGTTIDGDAGGMPYHWTEFWCDEHADLRRREHARMPWITDVTVTRLPAPGFRWAALLMIRRWVDDHAPQSAVDRLAEAEAWAAGRGWHGERYAFEVLRWWADQTPHIERTYVDRAWSAVLTVIEHEHKIRTVVMPLLWWLMHDDDPMKVSA